MDSSSKSLRETESSTAFSICPTGEASGASSLPLDEFSSCVPCSTGAEVIGQRLLVEACERTRSECTNQLSKMMDDLEMKDHQLMLKDW